MEERKIKKLFIILSLLLPLSITYSQDLVGDYRLTGLKEKVSYHARSETTFILNDALDMGLSYPMVFEAGQEVYESITGPFSNSILDQMGVNLNLSFYANGVASIGPGSFWPEWSEENLEGINTALILSFPRALAARTNVTAESIPPERPTMAFFKFDFLK